MMITTRISGNVGTTHCLFDKDSNLLMFLLLLMLMLMLFAMVVAMIYLFLFLQQQPPETRRPTHDTPASHTSLSTAIILMVKMIFIMEVGIVSGYVQDPAE